MKPPRHGASSNGGTGSAMPAQLIDQARRERAVDPQPHVGLAALEVAERDLHVVDPRRATRRGVGDRVARGVELVRAVLLRVGPRARRGEPGRQGHADQLPEGHGRIRARRPRPAERRVLARHDVLAVVAERHHEVVEVVFQLGDDDSGLGRPHADAAPVRVGVQIEVGNGSAHGVARHGTPGRAGQG